MVTLNWKRLKIFEYKHVMDLWVKISIKTVDSDLIFPDIDLALEWSEDVLIEKMLKKQRKNYLKYRAL